MNQQPHGNSDGDAQGGREVSLILTQIVAFVHDAYVVEVEALAVGLGVRELGIDHRALSDIVERTIGSEG